MAPSSYRTDPTILDERCPFIVLSWYHAFSTIDLSPGLVNILCRMMHPDPKLRPTVDEILGDRCVVLAGYQQSCYKACGRLFSVCKHVLGRLIAVLFFFLSVFPG